VSIVSVDKDFDDLSLVMVTEFDARIERVWQLWADPRQLERWWGPPAWPATVEKHELVAGGEVTYFMTGPQGERSNGWWRVTSVDPPRSLEFTDGFAGRAHAHGAAIHVRVARPHGPDRAHGGVRRLRTVGWTDGFNSRGGSLVRRIKSYFFVSLDGVVESPDKWHFPYFDEEMGAAVGAGFATSDALLMGRVLYDEWAAYWPEHADEDFGDVMNSMKKYVVSDSLRSAEWQNSEVVNGDVARRLADIKAQDGGDITMSGSATTVRWLLRQGLLDELNLLVHPIVVGDGLARLFPPDEPGVPLELAGSQTLKSGVLNLSYVPAAG
jgi:dihydrofolate reductase